MGISNTMDEASEYMTVLDLDEDVDSLTYDALKARCKTFGIKCNLKKTEMRWALKQLAKGETIPDIYFTKRKTKSWISNPETKKKIQRGSIGVGGTVLLIIIAYIIFSVVSGNNQHPTNSTNITNYTL